ncbi:dual specificity protein phosphatase 23-like isoform X2 [Ylistrum balloti]|uniref:dual specificity protein phosphatase 23-like isoform X2 n=1 Tax=Ylistrum balloti TaxID=509963 RepID=UPI002905AA27|nr:dual specificity protein phosphatase 23-like isoform X2 [Ylistrum balloti]
MTTLGDALKSRMPKNFSWVVEDQVCAMGFPDSPENMMYLVENNVRTLVSLTAERQPLVKDFPEITLFPIKVVDFTPPTLEQIDQCIDIIEKTLLEGKAAGLHCAHGKGRTGTVLACYFIKEFCMEPKKALEQIRIYRPGSVETQEQEQVIFEYANYIKVKQKPKC